MLKDRISINIKFWLIFIGIFVGRFMLLGEGHLDDTDEIPFLELLKQSDKLFQFDVAAWNNQVFVMWSTYFETLYRLPQVFILKWYASWIDMPIESTQALAAVAFFNLIVVMAISYVFYRILLRLSFDKNLSLLGMLLLASFINSNLYIRHINSYESSFLIHLIALFVLLKNKLTWKDYWVVGTLTAIAYYDYYGFFMMFLIIWIIGIYRLEAKSIKNIACCTISLSLPAFVLLFFFQGVSVLSGHSYFDYLFLFSTTIFHGSPEETLTYVYQYLHLVEGNWGLLFLVMTGFGMMFMFFYRKSYSALSKVVLLSGLIAYLVYGLYAVITKEMVFYGRVFHMYYPFMVIAVLMLIQKYKRLVPFVYVIASICFVLSINNLKEIGYPRTIVYQLGLFDEHSDYQFVNEIEPGIEYNYKKLYFEQFKGFPTYKINLKKGDAKFKGELILKNFSFFYHYPDSFMNKYQELKRPEGYKKRYSRPHFMSHPAYTFEYCTRYGRAFFLDKKFEITIYQKQ